MSVAPIEKIHVHGYELIRVQAGAWTVCTEGDRLASFATQEEATAYAFSLPARRPAQAKAQKTS
ncbi:DUF2188 domain-containing protein [Pseudomonas sp. UBA4194]|jgi:hypothetical protein|uniref:DUF2188 domain-containing protein n=1 Tax=Pseudomonas sp. UBA4194 TaxID=1947317 RepID=UPI0025D367E8|nr:DUF2188 domain-containing protein [Pseudomonas sp. UBA4194]